MNPTAFEVRARLNPREGELDGFLERAAEMIRLTRELDTKTLRYDWFISAARTACEAREGYTEADGLLEHNIHVREARDVLFRDYAYGHDMTIYGEPSPALTELMERMAGHVQFHRFSLIQGLGSEQLTGGPNLFEATAHLKIRDDKLDAFKQQAAELLRQISQTNEPPLRYDWFLNDDGNECEVREAYPDADSLLQHQQQIAGAKMKLFQECVESHTMAFYGEMSPALAGALQAMGTTYTTFSFLQGLNAEIDLRDQVPAST
jgi:quinol monooxygenase YgiN